MLQFKSESLSRLAGEYEQLRGKNPGLLALIDSVVEFAEVSFGKSVVITHIFRTRSQQASFYSDSDRRVSPHEKWLAVDLRHWIYTVEEKTALVQFMKSWDATNQMNRIPAAGSRTVWLHQIPNQAMHFHLQYYGPTVYQFSQGMTITA